MGSSLRCCLACVFPFGALDLIRIVHSNGHIEELTGPVTVGEVLKINPNHVLTKPDGSQSPFRRISILAHESMLKRGSIYFLVPASSISPNQISKEKIDAAVENCGAKVQTMPNKKTCFRRRLSRNKSTVGVFRPHLDSISEDM